ncbi:MAG: DUF3791 domain-containing protein [Ruminococcus sp.]|nr:DUF3791 domain-containing protein [Ruminococcus sp.]
MAEPIQNLNELEFVFFCIENIAHEYKAKAQKIYDILKEKNIINGYIVPEYDVLHTQSKEYIIEELCQVMQERDIHL